MTLKPVTLVYVFKKIDDTGHKLKVKKPGIVTPKLGRI